MGRLSDVRVGFENQVVLAGCVCETERKADGEREGEAVGGE